MKKHFYILIFLFLLTSTPNYLKGQEVMTINDIYQIPSENILSQFVVEFPNINAASIKYSVEKWSHTFFVNPKEVTLVNSPESMIFLPILSGHFKAGMGLILEVKVTCKTVFEFRDGRMRVTITEQPSLYTSGSGVTSGMLKDNFDKIQEFKPKGIFAPTYNQLIEGKTIVGNYIAQIKGIAISEESKSDNW
jgi:hypothetical protein